MIKSVERLVVLMISRGSLYYLSRRFTLDLNVRR